MVHQRRPEYCFPFSQLLALHFPSSVSRFLFGYVHLHIFLTSLYGENPTLIFSLVLRCIQHAAGALALDHRQGWQSHSGHDKLGLAYSCRMLAPWSHTDWWSLVLHSDRCSWALICWQGWMKKEDSHWKQIYEKSPIPHMAIEGEAVSTLIWERNEHKRLNILDWHSSLFQRSSPPKKWNYRKRGIYIIMFIYIDRIELD